MDTQKKEPTHAERISVIIEEKQANIKAMEKQIAGTKEAIAKEKAAIKALEKTIE